MAKTDLLTNKFNSAARYLFLVILSCSCVLLISCGGNSSGEDSIDLAESEGTNNSTLADESPQSSPAGVTTSTQNTQQHSGVFHTNTTYPTAPRLSSEQHTLILD